MLCSEWVPSEWESDKNITIIHTTPVHQLMVLRKQVLKQIHQDIFNINSLFLAKIRVHNHNKTPPPVKKCSGVNQELNLQRSSTVYKAKQLLMNMWVDFDVRGKQEMDFFTVWSIIMDYGHFSQKQWIYLIRDLFLTNSQLFTSQDVNWWTEMVWITVMFLSAVFTLILTAPIHCRASTGEQWWWNYKLLHIGS